ITAGWRVVVCDTGNATGLAGNLENLQIIIFYLKIPRTGLGLLLAVAGDHGIHLAGIAATGLGEHPLEESREDRVVLHQAGVSHDNPKEFAEVAKINPDRFYGVSGCSTKNYGNILLPIDIGIVPLEKVSFNEAKSGLKGMEYSFTGVPFVATDTEEYKRLVADGAGNTARKTRDWIRNLERLLDPEQRKIDADRGYQTVMEKYNINIVVNKWIDTIEYIRSTNPKAR
ncbi:MAG: glycosyltransferase family 1 protein, partial [Micrococcales bacterium]|nr:glycosyltransferase family 1 protein [Micrococcales bacterium]